MALPTTTVWEVRPTAGADTNGGGFVPGSAGTDWTQQNAAEYALTNGVTQGTTVILTASAATDMVGNIAYVAGGTGSVTAAWYQITAATAGVSITVDRSTGLTSGTGVTINIGGALATVSQAYTSSSLSNTIWVKASGNYTVTASLTLTTTNPTPLSIIGYTTTRGDGGKFTWTTSTNSTFLVEIGAGNPCNFIFQNILFTNTASTRASCFDGGLSGQGLRIRCINCTFSGFTAAMTAGYAGGVNFNIAFVSFEFCEIKDCTVHGIICSGGMSFFACFIHDNTGDGIHIANVVGSGIDEALNSIHIERCVFYNAGANAINVDDAFGVINNPLTLLISNSALINSTDNGILLNSTSGLYIEVFLVNSIIDSNGAYGLNNAGNSLSFRSYNNAYGSGATANASGDVNGTGFVKDAGSITLTADPFTSRSTGNFTLNSTAGGGAACTGAGYPTTLP